MPTQPLSCLFCKIDRVKAPRKLMQPAIVAIARNLLPPPILPELLSMSDRLNRRGQPKQTEAIKRKPV
jgi:hypothetical protein